MAHEITDTLDKDIITIVQQALDGKIDSGQAMKRVRRAQRLAQIARYQVPIADVRDGDLDRISRSLGLE